MQADDILNVGATSCGELIMLVFQRMKALEAGEVLEVVTYDPGAAQDIPAWCRMTSNPLLEVLPKGSTTSYFIRKEKP